jgi:hypothetical protein
MRAHAILLGLTLLLVACDPTEEPVPTTAATTAATIEATATPAPPPIAILPTFTPTPTPTPLPAAAPSGLWVFDLARGRQELHYEGTGEVVSRIEPQGNAVSATVANEEGITATRFGSNGDRLEEHPDRGLITTSANGESRFYLNLEDPEAPQLALEHRGAEVQLEGTRPRVGIAFSPSGDQLLTLSERSGAGQDEVIRTYSVHSATDGRLRMQFEHRVLVGAPELVAWSPSARYVSDQSLDGLFVRDTVTGSAWRLGPRGSYRWSPAADRLIAITDAGRLSIVDIPDLDGVDLGPVDGAARALFDRTGALAIVTSYADPATRGSPTTRAFEVNTGAELAVWPGSEIPRGIVRGAEPVIALDLGIVAAFGTGTGCDGGFVVYHPALGDAERCIEGANPQWSPNAQLLVYAREREIILLSLSSDVERVIARGTPPPDARGGPMMHWSPDGSWLLIEWHPSEVDTPQ